MKKNTDFIFANKEDLWSYAGSALNVFMLPYSLFLFCKKVTNNVPGTILTFLFAGLAYWYWYWYCLNECDWVLTYVFIANSMAVLILLSYIADPKKDYARNGFYAFPIAHWMVMGIVFAEIYFLSRGICSIPIAIAVSALITAGVHFIARPKKI